MSRLISFVIGLLCCIAVVGQTPYYYSVNDETGSPSNEIYCAVQDSSGFIWLGCEAGLFRYDGFEFKHFNNAQQNGRAISSLRFDYHGRLWCQNFAGQIYLVRNDSLIIYSDVKDKIKNHPCFDFNEAGDLFIGLPDGLLVVDPRGNQKHMFQDEIAITEIMYLGGDSLLIQNQISFYYLLMNSEKIIPLATKDELIHSCWMDKRNKSGYAVFSNNLNQIFHVMDLKNQQVLDKKFEPVSAAGFSLWYTFYQTDKRTVWISTSTGAWCYDLQNQQLKMHLFRGEKISNMLVDREGNYWFTSLENGMYVIPEINLRIYNENDNLIKDQNISAMHVMNDSTLICGSFDGSGFLLNISTGEVSYLNQKPELRYRTVSSIFRYNNQWMLARNYISIFDSLFQNEQTLKTNYTRDIAPDKQRFYFASALGSGYFDYSHEILANNLFSPVLISEQSGRLVECDTVQHKVWFAQSDGLAIYHHDSLIYLTHQGERIYPSTLTYYNNVLWVGTSDMGLFAFVNDTVKYHWKKQCVLNGNSVTAFAINDQLIACATEAGVQIIFPDTRETFLLDLTDGINTKDINALALHHEYLFIASTRGLYQYPLSSLRKNKTKIQVKLTDILVNNERMTSVPVEMNYDDDLRIRFNAASFRSRGQFYFRYKFSKDKAWNYVDGKNRELYFRSLASGEYELWLDAVNEDGYSNESFLKIQLVVYPPFWQRWWFYLVLVLFTGLLAALFYSWQIKNIRRKSLMKEKMVRYQLRTIKAQMNPHFIFNSLTSIQDLILQQDISNSYLYLTKFSSILRMVIDLTDADEISMADEIKFLTLYLDIEKLRFGADFEYSIQTPDENETHYANLPPLLIQPFVENAIKHGLLHKRGEKKLQIHFNISRSNDDLYTIHCIIRDNGIGRKRSQEIKERMTVSHQSFATRATEQRLELLNGRDDYRVEFAIEDLYSGLEAAGTQVNITITANTILQYSDKN